MRRAEPASDRGALLFARYAYPPNALGYCGPADHAALLEHGARGEAGPGLVELARRFEGAWPYLRIIAAANGIDDPLDARVVEAYWVGNGLLGRVAPADLARWVDGRFGPLPDRLGAALLSARGIHHNLHVFVLSPWLGLLRLGHDGPEPLRVLDACRIAPGRVLAVDGETARVRSRSIAFDGRRVALGPSRVEVARVSSGGLGLVPNVRPGDLVALHWGWVCDRLSPRRAAALARETRRALAAASADPRQRARSSTSARRSAMRGWPSSSSSS